LLLWSLVDDPRLSERARSLIEDPENTVVASQVVLWETAVKRALKRYAADFPFTPEQVKRELTLAGAEWLMLDDRHLFTLAGLPLLHRDPFDRLLVAQAMTEPLRLLTHDRHMAAYSDTVILV
jgi:PIN domain nuclease of toxin-antitoxin system